MADRVVESGGRVALETVESAPVVQLVQDGAVPLQPGTFDLSIYRGDSYEWYFQLFALQFGDDGWTPTPLPIDITNWRFKAEIRPSPDGPLMASLQRMIPQLPSDAAAQMRSGVVWMRLTPNQSSLVTSAGVWDLQATTKDGWVKTVCRGAVSVVSDVTTGKYPAPLGGA